MSDPNMNSPTDKSNSDNLLQSLFRAAAMSSRESIQPRSLSGPAPLSASQQQMWFINQLYPDSPVYNAYRAFYIRGQLDLAVLRDSIHEIVRRQDALRTVFYLKEDVPIQVVQPDMDFDFSLKDLSGNDIPHALSGDQFGIDLNSPKHKQLNELLVAEACKTFDLQQGPCLRVSVFKLNEKEYCFQLVMHHIVCDGWSLSVFFSELASLYEAFSHGRVSTLEALPVQYNDYAVWQQEWLQSDAVGPHVDYWMDHLQGYPRNLNMPANYRRPSVQSFRGSTENFIVPEQLTDRLKKFSSQEGATLFMTLLAAYQVLLYRYSGQTDIVTGSPIASRNHPETHDMIGCFINTLALRTDLTGSPGFRELLSRVRVMTLDAYAHQDLPFQVLVEKVQSSRDMTFSPLFQTSFVLQNTPELVREFAGLTFKLLNVDNETAKYDLTLAMTEDEGRLTGEFEYSVDLFDAGTVRNLIQHFQMLLESILADPDRPVSELSFLTEDEKHRQLVEWNDTGTDYPGNKCIRELFEEQVQRTPDSTAVIFDGQELSYGELNGKANQLAHYLKSQGVEPEVLVGICIERSLDMVIGILAILKAGGAYVPLDPDYPKERLHFMLEDTGVTLLLTKSTQSKELPESKAHMICMDTDWKMIEQEKKDNPFIVNSAEHLAYVMYTSGSTGTPKGISVLHRGVVRLVYQPNYVDISPKDVFLQFAPITFDASTFEIWGSLLNGAKLIISPPGKLSLEKLGQVIQKYQVSTLWLSAGLFHLMTDERIDDLKSVRNLLAGGDVLSVSHVRRFLEKTENCKLINGYGPTENTTFTCCYTVTDAEKLGDSVPIGRPVSDTRVYILDAHLQPLPIGVSGELYIGGDGLAREYYNRPELTYEKFIPNPFSKKTGARLYISGDKARYLPDGNIEFIGRIDNQVKVRGYRIEPGEIESVLVRHPEVTGALVIAREENDGEKRLVSYVLVKDKSKDITGELRNVLKKNLPDYMVPSAFVLMEAFPLSPNGKIDRQALPDPSAGRTDQERSFSPYQSLQEAKLIKIWREIFKREDIGRDDDFFDLGGHSLLAMRLIAWVRRDLQVELSIHNVFEFSTIADLAKIIYRESQKQD